MYLPFEFDSTISDRNRFAVDLIHFEVLSFLHPEEQQEEEYLTRILSKSIYSSLSHVLFFSKWFFQMINLSFFSRNVSFLMRKKRRINRFTLQWFRLISVEFHNVVVWDWLLPRIYSESALSMYHSDGLSITKLFIHRWTNPSTKSIYLFMKIAFQFLASIWT